MSAFAGLATIGTASAQQNITVMIDRSPMSFPDQAPIDQGGRVFVPMRAIFERLGAAVVYSNGTINATRGSQTVQLHVGSPVATIDGQQTQLDAPPFVVDDRALVPLRFVSQALGANVDWSEAQMTVYITTNGGARGGAMPPYHPGTSHAQPGPAWADAGHSLLHRPSPWGEVSQQYPLVNASFREPLRRDTVRVTLDGRDVSGIARITSMGVEFTPAFRLHAGTHTVHVSGLTQSGMRVSDGWSFTVTP